MNPSRMNETVDDQQTEWATSAVLLDENALLRKWELSDEGAEAHMFTEDVHHGVIPYARQDAMQITLTPEDERARDLVADALRRNRSYRDRLDEAVIDFIRECTQTLMSFGKAQYEIVTQRVIGSDDPVGFRLQWVMPYTICRKRRRWVQDLGSKVAEERRRDRFLPVDVSRIITFELPKPLTPRKFLRIKKELAQMGTSLIPEFGLDPASQPPGYDFASFIRQRERALAAVTRELGWNGRGSIGKHMTEYYYAARDLRFRRFLLSLREAILAKLNSVLKVQLRRFSAQGQIAISGLLTNAEIETLETILEHPTDLRALARRIMGHE
jgi:hypothetical protein